MKGEVDFQTLKRELQLTDGGLFSHLRALEQEGFVNYRKEFHGRRPATIYVLTLKGKNAFEEFRKQMVDILS